MVPKVSKLLLVACAVGLVLTFCIVPSSAQNGSGDKKRFAELKAQCEKLLADMQLQKNKRDLQKQLADTIRQLGQIKGDYCVKYLSGVFSMETDERNFVIRCAVVEALGEIGTSKAFKVLVKIAAKHEGILQEPGTKSKQPHHIGGFGGTYKREVDLGKAIVKAIMDQVREDNLDTVCVYLRRASTGKVRKFLVIAIGKKKLQGAFESLKDLLKGKDPDLVAETMIAIAKIATDPELGAEVIVPLAKSSDWTLRAIAMDALALLPCSQSVDACIKCLGDKVWQVRAAAIQALARLCSSKSIEPLIDTLEKESNERLIGDILDALRYLTGANYECDAKLWRKWWEAVKEEFRTPRERTETEDDGEIGDDGPATGLPEPPPPPPRPKYYGMELKSFHVIFIIDRSGSMTGRMTTTIGGKQVSGTKHEIAIKELTKVISMMDKRYWFNVIFYNQQFEVWQKKLTKATEKARKAAIKWINSVQPEGSTNIGDSLEEAFKDKKVDTIYLLSDGQANTGKYPDAGSIIGAVKGWNRKKRIKINTISFGRGADTQFMEELARMTGGKHVKK